MVAEPPPQQARIARTPHLSARFGERQPRPVLDAQDAQEPIAMVDGNCITQSSTCSIGIETTTDGHRLGELR
jgi:hypothetical protein